jgi:hypothetical protein
MSLVIKSDQLKDNNDSCFIDEDEESERQSVTHCFDSPACNDKPSCVGCPLFKG